MHFRKAGVDGLQPVDRTVFDAIEQTVYFTLRSDQSGHIHPFAGTDFRVRFQTLAYFFVTLEINAFQAFYDGVTQKLMNSDLIKTDTII